MKKTTNWQLTLALVFVAGLAGGGQAAAAGDRETNPQFTIHVYNYAGVNTKTLSDAEKTASQTFQRTGVLTVWADAPVRREPLQSIPGEQKYFGLADIQLQILPREMADRLAMSSDVAGLAVGEGPDRCVAFVFYNRVIEVARSQRDAGFNGLTSRIASTQQILGEVIAHEIGHILLNLDVHTKTGIMRGNWDSKDLLDIACDYMNFSMQQAAAIRTEVLRRADSQEASEVPLRAPLDSAR